MPICSVFIVVSKAPTLIFDRIKLSTWNDPVLAEEGWVRVAYLLHDSRKRIFTLVALCGLWAKFQFQNIWYSDASWSSTSWQLTSPLNWIKLFLFTIYNFLLFISSKFTYFKLYQINSNKYLGSGWLVRPSPSLERKNRSVVFFFLNGKSRGCQNENSDLRSRGHVVADGPHRPGRSQSTTATPEVHRPRLVSTQYANWVNFISDFRFNM